MKELSIEEKAKRYDEAIERANELNYVSDKNSLQHKTVEHIFPELKESEDEKIKKDIVEAVELYKDFTQERKEHIYVWFEKQVDHAKFINSIQVGDRVTRNEDGVLVNLSQLNRIAKKQGEQEPIYPLAHEKMETERWKEACKAACSDRNYRSHYGLTETRDDYFVDGVHWADEHPKQKPIEWSEEDKKMLNDILMCGERHCYLDAGNIAWLKSLKDRVQLQQKQVWSEEEIEKAAQEWDLKANFNPFYMTMDGDKPTGVNQDITTHKESFKAGVNWILKSLRPQKQWKPSDEQMEALKGVQEGVFRLGILESLYQDLKKLKG